MVNLGLEGERKMLWESFLGRPSGKQKMPTAVNSNEFKIKGNVTLRKQLSKANKMVLYETT